MRTDWKIGAITGLAALISIVAVGTAYAHDNAVVSSISLCKFSWVESNDDASGRNRGGYSPVDPGDNGADPSAAQVSGVFCQRAGNSALATASYTPENITFSLNNIYPGYHPTIFFGLSNCSAAPGTVTALTVVNPNPSLLTMTFKGIASDQVILSGSEALGALDIAVGDLPKSRTTRSYRLSATIVVNQCINRTPARTSTHLTSLPNPSDRGQTVIFGAAVTSDSGGQPTGSVTFMEGTAVLGTGELFHGLTSFYTAELLPGSHNITAVYAGNSNYSASSSTLVQNVNKANTRIVLSTSGSPVKVGKTVIFTAIAAVASSGSGTPGGTVTFKEGAMTLGTVILNGGQAIFTTSALSRGSHAITAVYGGDSSFNVAVSAELIQIIDQVKTVSFSNFN